MSLNLFGAESYRRHVKVNESQRGEQKEGLLLENSCDVPARAVSSHRLQFQGSISARLSRSRNSSNIPTRSIAPESGETHGFVDAEASEGEEYA